jgi:uncharacterized protein
MAYDTAYQRDNSCNCGNVYPNHQVKINRHDYSMKVNGKGSIKIRPDIVSATLGVVTEDKQLQNAQRLNAEIMNRVINTIKSFGIEDNQIQTVSYNINAVYDYSDGKEVFRGYRVSNIVKVIVRNVGKIGEIIDAAVAAGANHVGNIEFTTSDPAKYYRRALMMAIKDAVEKAEIIGETLGVAVNKTPVNIKEETQGYEPMVQRAEFKALGVSTPIEAGQIEVSASVEAQFIYK